MGKLFFTTLFNSFYICKGLALYESLIRTCDDFHIYIFAFDEKTFKYLSNIKLKNATILSLCDLEQFYPELTFVKCKRTLVEYCWTTTSYTIEYCLKKYNINHCTYLDADLYFFSNPRVLVDEIMNDDVIVTEHRYTPCYDQSATSGKYCVQFMTFKNTKNGLYILDWWKKSCFNWCYNRFEDGKFGDQKYLDDWTDRFTGIHVLQNFGGGLAPWNIQQYHMDGNALMISKSNEPIIPVFYHFHYFRYHKVGMLYEYIFGPYLLTIEIKRFFYKRYLAIIKKYHAQVLKDGFLDNDVGYENLNVSKLMIIPHILKTLFNHNKLISML